MAMTAVARETVFALRRQIAKIEGTLPERLAAGARPDARADIDVRPGIAPKITPEITILRRGIAVAAPDAFLRTGVERLDTALSGGLPKAALSEIHGAETRDAGAVAGFALSLTSLILRQEPHLPVLWIGTSEIFREAGFPYARGLHGLFGIEPEQLLFSEAPKLVDALWIAEEAARMTALAAVILEIRGSPQRLDLTATRRLHARAQNAGRPVLLLRQAGEAEPTAAPVRLIVSAAPSASRDTIAGPLAGSIGRPAFTVSIGKSRTALPGQFTLEWNPDEHTFEERRQERTTNPVAVVPASGRRTHPAPASGAVLAFPAVGSPAAGDQPSRPQRPAHISPRRAG
ncbi:ImuA family protein [Mesorhizobium sp. LjNodule214]|uniref:ImuA family protein n=1 Tax=Mesorhizobium sp. LjNodule214 TaxID=3342252 RepID=UPI003ED013FB